MATPPIETFGYRSLIVPVFTVFHENGTVNFSIIPSYAEYLANAGVTGILVNGTIGEGMSMSIDERKRVVKAWARETERKKLHLMVQVGGVPLPYVVELANHAAKMRANFILCLPELYYKPNSADDLIDYLKIVSNAAPATPLIYYHAPAITNVNIHIGHFLEAVGDKLPSLVGVKFTNADLQELPQALQAQDKKFLIFFDNDQRIYDAYTMGANSFISTSVNMFPKFIKDIFAAFKNGDVSTAKVTQEKLANAVIAITKQGNWVTTMKLAMLLFTDIDIGKCRRPLLSLSTETELEIIEDLAKLELYVMDKYFKKS